MRDIFKLFGIIALAAIIGFSMIACSNGTGKDDSTISNGSDTPASDSGNKTKPDGSNPGTTGSNPGTTGGDTNSWTVTNTEEWNNAVTKIASGGNNKSYTITVTGNVSGGYNFSVQNENITVTLNGSGTISPLSNITTAIIINNKQTCIIDGITLNESGIQVYGGILELKNGNISRSKGIVIFNDATFTMSGGTINNSSTHGVTVSGSTFTMTGGTISDNKGSGVDVINSTVSTSTFTMTDGTINGNEGPGVFVSGNKNSNSNFTMTGGTISGNGSSGVYAQYSNFTMTGGTISGNTSSIGGGGVFSAPGTFTMKGGTISGNTAGLGGGVYSGGTFTMSGGTISENTASSAGGGAFVFDSILFSKTGGIIYGKNGGNKSNIVTRSDGNSGDAVYNGVKLRNTTLGVNDSISTESASGWISY